MIIRLKGNASATYVATKPNPISMVCIMSFNFIFSTRYSCSMKGRCSCQSSVVNFALVANTPGLFGRDSFQSFNSLLFLAAEPPGQICLGNVGRGEFVDLLWRE